MSEINQKILRLPSVVSVTGFSRSAIYNFVKAGSFPKPINISARSTGWVESEVQEWIRNRIQASR